MKRYAAVVTQDVKDALTAADVPLVSSSKAGAEIAPDYAVEGNDVSYLTASPRPFCSPDTPRSLGPWVIP